MTSSIHPLWQLSHGKSRSIGPENPTGGKGHAGMSVDGVAASCARDLGPGWKLNPFIIIPAGGINTLAEIEGPGILQSMWFGGTAARDHSRMCILRIYWDGQSQPSVECPLGDFFASGWGGFSQVSSLTVAVNPNRGLNCFWEMPFLKSCTMTLQNLSGEEVNVYYQVNYMLLDLPEDVAFFHAQFRRVNPLPYKSVYTILDGVHGAGQYAGTCLEVGVTNNGWWGEGEVKFYLDGDEEFPTICNTGTEDYFGGSYDWDVNGVYTPYTTLYQGMHQLTQSDGLYHSQQRFAAYRWHISDPVCFEQDIRVTLQALGWRSGGRYLPLQCDIASVAYWYQRLPTTLFPPFPDRDYLEII